MERPRPRGDSHTHTRGRGVAGPAMLVHTPEVDQSENPGPPHWARQPVSLRAGVPSTGLLLFHRAIPTVEIAGREDSADQPYARFTQ